MTNIHVKPQFKTMLTVSFQEFEAHPQQYLDQVDLGVDILLRRNEHKSYRLSPADTPLDGITDTYILSPDDDLERAISAEKLLTQLKADLHVIFQQKHK